jgi:hypothetical protein
MRDDTGHECGKHYAFADRSAKRQRHDGGAEVDGRHEPIHAPGPLMHGGNDGPVRTT